MLRAVLRGRVRGHVGRPARAPVALARRARRRRRRCARGRRRAVHPGGRGPRGAAVATGVVGRGRLAAPRRRVAMARRARRAARAVVQRWRGRTRALALLRRAAVLERRVRVGARAARLGHGRDRVPHAGVGRTVADRVWGRDPRQDRAAADRGADRVGKPASLAAAADRGRGRRPRPANPRRGCCAASSARRP